MANPRKNNVAVRAAAPGRGSWCATWAIALALGSPMAHASMSFGGSLTCSDALTITESAGVPSLISCTGDLLADNFVATSDTALMIRATGNLSLRGGAITAPVIDIVSAGLITLAVAGGSVALGSALDSPALSLLAQGMVIGYPVGVLTVQPGAAGASGVIDYGSHSATISVVPEASLPALQGYISGTVPLSQVPLFPLTESTLALVSSVVLSPTSGGSLTLVGSAVTPVPEPSMSILLAAGAALVGATCRRRSRQAAAQRD